MKKLSIIIPVYNEIGTLEKILKKIEEIYIPVEKEIILIDDGSTDGTRELMRNFTDKYKIIFHEKNLGKGGAVHSGIKAATGDYIIIQDADLEYDPNDYIKLLEEAEKGKYKAVYGSRNLMSNPRFKKSYYYGGKMITFFANLLYGAKLTDVNTCYKMINTEVARSLNLEQTNFSFCEEVTAKLIKNKYEIKEVPINYYPRKFDDGKKIRATDGIRAIVTLLKYRFTK